MAEEKACMSEEDLKAIENDIRDLINWVEVWNLEEIIIRTLADFGIGGQRVSGLRGKDK